MKRALLVIDMQNDYFEGGKFPLWNTQKVLDNIVEAIEKAKKESTPVIHIQHVAGDKGLFFNRGTEGVKIHKRIFDVDPEPIIVQKQYADGFYETKLTETLEKLNVDELLICGMMTQNCVTHTALSKSAEKYSIKVLADCCTTVDEPIHLIALNALSTRVDLKSYKEIF